VSSPSPSPAALTASTWRVVWFSLIAAVVSLGGFLGTLLQHAPRGAWAAGIITAVGGFQVGNARRLFSYRAPDEIRPWMRPVSIALYVVSAALFVFAIWTAAAR
jgi:hypothetical protein